MYTTSTTGEVLDSYRPAWATDMGVGSNASYALPIALGPPTLPFERDK